MTKETQSSNPDNDSSADGKKPGDSPGESSLSQLTEVPESASEAEKMSHSYKVELDVFEGPLDLLLYLVKRDEIDIYDISIERITSQYMRYIETFKLLNIGLAGEFLVMAANLCYIKSRIMLPRHVQPKVEEESEEEDPRWDLIKQLIEYKKFKDAAGFLAAREQEEQLFYRNVPDKIELDQAEERPLSDDLNVFDLIRAFQNILDRCVDDEGLGEIVDDRYTVSDKIEFILESIPPGEKVSFLSLFQGSMSKHELIITFLAILELMKINLLRVFQETILGEIMIERRPDTEERLYHQPTRT